VPLFFHRHGEIRDRTFENQPYRASGLNLTIAAIILWNTVYLSRAVAKLRAQGEFLSDTLLAHIGPLGLPATGLEEERRIAKTTAVMLKGFENDQAVATAGKEFNEAQEIKSLLI
jgi:hypothetical protein